MFLKSDIPEEIIMAILAGKTSHKQKREIIRKILFKLQALLQHDSKELSRRLLQFEILGELRAVQKIIIEEENKMAITYNIERDIRYNQGLEKGMAIEKTAFVKYLLQNTTHSHEKIAELVNVPVEFVKEIKQSIQS